MDQKMTSSPHLVHGLVGITKGFFFLSIYSSAGGVMSLWQLLPHYASNDRERATNQEEKNTKHKFSIRQCPSIDRSKHKIHEMKSKDFSREAKCDGRCKRLTLEDVQFRRVRWFKKIINRMTTWKLDKINEPEKSKWRLWHEKRQCAKRRNMMDALWIDGEGKKIEDTYPIRR